MAASPSPKKFTLDFCATLNERPALALEDLVYNVAYGSNMDSTKLRQRSFGGSPCIRPLSEGVPCRVPGWALSFDYIVVPPIEPVMAGTVERAGAEMHGVLLKLSRRDYETLARTEGCVSPNSIYVERAVLAYPYENGGEPVEALVFALRNPVSAPPFLYPSERYLGMMVNGARSGGVLQDYIIEKLANVPTSRPEHWAVRGVSMFTVIGLFFCYQNDVFLRLITQYWMRALARIYSAREKAVFSGRSFVASVITAEMLIFMAPFALLGFFRAVYLRRDIVRLARGEHIIS